MMSAGKTMEKLLIIGVTGLIGGKVAEIADGRYEVYGTCNSTPVHGKNFSRLNVVDRGATFKLIDSIKPDWVVDAHGMSELDDCELHPEEAWSVNVDGSKNVAEACKKVGCKYVFMSVDQVFDGKRLRYTEKDKTRPLNYLSKTKAVMEAALDALDVNHLVIRTSTVYGRGGRPGRIKFALWLIDKLKKGEKVKVVTDRKSNPTFADNLAEIMLDLCRRDETGIFHVAGKECVNRYDFAKEIARTFDLNSNLILQATTPELNQIAVRPGNVNLVSDKAERITRIRTLTIREGVEILKLQLGG